MMTLPSYSPDTFIVTDLRQAMLTSAATAAVIAPPNPPWRLRLMATDARTRVVPQPRLPATPARATIALASIPTSAATLAPTLAIAEDPGLSVQSAAVSARRALRADIFLGCGWLFLAAALLCLAKAWASSRSRQRPAILYLPQSMFTPVPLLAS